MDPARKTGRGSRSATSVALFWSVPVLLALGACGGSSEEEAQLDAQHVVSERWPECASRVSDTNPKVRHGIIGFDCNSAADGPVFYLNESDGALISTCGGACMLGASGTDPDQWKACTTLCPPPGWE